MRLVYGIFLISLYSSAESVIFLLAFPHFLRVPFFPARLFRCPRLETLLKYFRFLGSWFIFKSEMLKSYLETQCGKGVETDKIQPGMNG